MKEMIKDRERIKECTKGGTKNGLKGWKIRKKEVGEKMNWWMNESWSIIVFLNINVFIGI